MKQLIAILTVTTIAVVGCRKKDSTPAPTAPLVTTAALSNVNIGAGSATAGGAIVSNGGTVITKSGIVWSPSNNTPTLTADSIVTSTTTTGAFTINISGLDFGKSYYFRAFATNSVGTGYGDVVTLTTSSDSVRFTYNGQSVTYGIITSSASGKKWLDRNLGASQVATVYDDYKAYGDLFQWGRPADGHQLINWTSSTVRAAVNATTTTTKATSDDPGHSNFIILADPFPTPYDWRSNNNNNRWNTTPKGPCPTGWHVPTSVEWKAEFHKNFGGTATSGGIVDRITAYSLLKLTVAGIREYDGLFGTSSGAAGNNGYYWSSSTHYDAFDVLYRGRGVGIGAAGADASNTIQLMNTALSVRCIKD